MAGRGAGGYHRLMARVLPMAAVGLVLLGCPMDNPAWHEYATTGKTTGGETVSSDSQVSASDGSASATSTSTSASTSTTSAGSGGTSTTDPTTAADTSTSEPITSGTTDTSTTGGLVCEVDDSLAPFLLLELSDVEPGFAIPEPPNCGEIRFFTGAISAIDGGIKVVADDFACKGSPVESWVKVLAKWPDGYAPVLPPDACARVFLHFVERGGVCEFAAYQIFQGPNPEAMNALDPLYVAGQGVVSLPKPAPLLHDLSPNATGPGCVPDPVTCDPPEGTFTLRWEAPQIEILELEEGFCGVHKCKALQTHVHSALDPNASCGHHVAWIVAMPK